MNLKLSPKLSALCQWELITEVNKRLDNGESPASVAVFINKNKFKISTPMVYEYAKMRKKALIDGINVEHMLAPTSQVIDKSDPQTQNTMSKLKSEIDALDTLIQSGYKTLIEYSDKPISPKVMMDAIRLKYTLTDGNNGFLTNYGMEDLKRLEQEKYTLIIQHLVSYIPEELRQEALDKIDEIEDTYYQSTPYYAEYLKAKGYSEQDIEQRMMDVASKAEES